MCFCILPASRTVVWSNCCEAHSLFDRLLQRVYAEPPHCSLVMNVIILIIIWSILIIDYEEDHNDFEYDCDVSSPCITNLLQHCFTLEQVSSERTTFEKFVSRCCCSYGRCSRMPCLFHTASTLLWVPIMISPHEQVPNKASLHTSERRIQEKVVFPEPCIFSCFSSRSHTQSAEVPNRSGNSGLRSSNRGLWVVVGRILYSRGLDALPATLHLNKLTSRHNID